MCSSTLLRPLRRASTPFGRRPRVLEENDVKPRVAGWKSIYETLRTEILSNLLKPGQLLDETARVDSSALELLREASGVLGLSARAFHRTMRVARTIADLDGAEEIGRMHIGEALGYRGEAMRQRQAA